MRRALIADIHGNLIALQAVLNDCQARGVEEILCLGDMIGFGPDGVECIDLVRDNCKWSLAGDFEVRLSMLDGERGMNPHSERLMQREKRLLYPRWYSLSARRKRWQWLKSLEPRKEYAGALFVHGSPRDSVWEFIDEHEFGLEWATPMMTEIFEMFDGLCFSGHSHRGGYALDVTRWHRAEDGLIADYGSQANGKMLVNVGSVGQPRDLDPRSCYAIWDDERRTITFHRVAYDLAATRKRFERVAGFYENYYLRLEKGI